MNHLSDTDVSALVEAIKTAENHSTGEIRVHIDSSTEQENERVAWEVFEKLQMHETKDRNAVLFHVNFAQKYLSTKVSMRKYARVFGIKYMPRWWWILRKVTICKD